ncbi:hydrogenase [Arcobacter sp. FWKO B]|nr:hydrogenase [Arcobacter sp. FWKO B]
MLWLSGISCYGNIHSFFNYPHMEVFLEDFEFIYHPVLDSTFSLKEIVNETKECNILLIDGAISDDFHRADVNIKDIINRYATSVNRIVTVGTCATFGGIFKYSDFQSPRGLHFCGDELQTDFLHLRNKTISISGCPIQPEVLVNTLYEIKNQTDIKLDTFLRPKEYYAYTVHNGCTRNEYFEYKVDGHKFGELEGCLFYDHGCQAPYTAGSCNKILWNEQNSKTRSGSPCFGCTEYTFPKMSLYDTKKNMGIPQNLPLGVPKRAYLTIAGVTKAFSIQRLEKKLIDD